ncbi:MAG: glycosyltransferase family 2 protein [Candidatus Baltobacteraceae bacterium]
MNSATLTVVILTRNEEQNLPRALASLPENVAVLVLDAQSTDRTVAIARQAGAQVIVRPWSDFVEARMFALRAVQTPWALMLDADEVLDDTLRRAIARNCEPGSHEPLAPQVEGYRLSRTTFFCGKPMRIWRGESLLRLFRTDRARLQASPVTGSDAALHEHWIVDGPTGDLAGTLLHHSYPTLASYRAKFDRYTSIEAEHLRVSWIRVVCAAAVALARFWWLLLVRGAIWDGWRGWYVALGSAFYAVVVECKTRDCGRRT